MDGFSSVGRPVVARGRGGGAKGLSSHEEEAEGEGESEVVVQPQQFDGKGQPVDTQAGAWLNRALGFGGAAMSAHPHVDPHCPGGPRFVAWGWTQLAREGAMRISLRELDQAWRTVCEASFVMEGCTLAPHDFAITPDYYLFMENRMAMDMAPCE